jgi:hypothetical protein
VPYCGCVIRDDPGFGVKKTASFLRWTLLITLATLTVWLSVRIVYQTPDRLTAVVPLATLVPALVVLVRRDWHIVGWLLLATAVINAAQFAETVPMLSSQWQAWLYGILNVAFWAVMATLVAVFPDGLGRQLGAARVGDRAIVISVWIMTLISALTSEVEASGWNGSASPPRYDNPIGLRWIPVEMGTALTAMSIIAFILATATLVVRTRSATGAVRQQHIWVLFPFAVLVFGVPVAILVTELRGGEAGGEWLIAVVGYIAIPICFGVAMTRYRLYDIGKIISRTVTYGIVVIVLGATYFGLVALITSLLPSQNAFAVAGSTLAVAALFNPIRRRIQRTVDKRFNRSSYEAEAIFAHFAARLQESLSIEELADVWNQTVAEAFQPEAAGVWLSEPHQQRKALPHDPPIGRR